VPLFGQVASWKRDFWNTTFNSQWYNKIFLFGSLEGMWRDGLERIKRKKEVEKMKSY